MLAVAKGGTSVYGADKTTDLLFLPVVAMQHGLGKFTYADLNKALAGKQVSLQLALDDYTRSLSGNTTPKDLKTYMEMLYMTFTGLNVTADEFAALQSLYAFPMKPEKKDRALEIIRNEFEKLAKETPVEELNKVKEFMVKQYAENEHTNSYWCSMMSGNELKPSEVCVQAEQTIQTITPEEISKFVSEVMQQNNYRVLVLMPE